MREGFIGNKKINKADRKTSLNLQISNMAYSIETRKCSRGQSVATGTNELGKIVPVDCVHMYRGKSDVFCLLTTKQGKMSKCNIEPKIQE
jgi:hypothetical protein